MNNYKKIIKNNGFTLIEITVYLGIVMIIVGAIMALQNYMLKQGNYAMGSYLTIENASQSLQNLVKEIRNAKNSENGAYVLEVCNDQELIFFSDIDHDSQVERVRYFLQNGQFKKGIIKPIGYPITYPTNNESVILIAEGIVNQQKPIFYYYNENWPTDQSNNPLPQTSRRLDTRLIKIEIFSNSNQNYFNTDYKITNYAQIRILKDNI